MSNELVVANQNFPTEREIQSIQFLAKTAHASGLYSGVGQEAKIMMVLFAARELGISPCMALNGGIWNIQGKIEVSARCMNAMIRRAGHSIKVVRSDEQVCTLVGKRSDGDTFECTFSIEEAVRAGLANGNAWKKYPTDMLYNRCMSRLARRLFADVIGEAYIEGEIREAKMSEMDDLSKLTPSEYECITPVKIEPNIELSEEQISELEGLYKMLDESVQNNMYKSMTKMGANSIREIPLKHYEFFKDGMLRNIKSPILEAVVNA